MVFYAANFIREFRHLAISQVRDPTFVARLFNKLDLQDYVSVDLEFWIGKNEYLLRSFQLSFYGTIKNFQVAKSASHEGGGSV